MLSAAIAQASTATAAETLRILHELGFGRSAPMDPISPQRYYEAIQNVYSRLVRQGEDGRPSADLALEWPATPDAKEWIFRQRPGVTFHYGNAFTAGDVAFSLMRTQPETINSPTKSVMGIIDHAEAVAPDCQSRSEGQPPRLSAADYGLLHQDAGQPGPAAVIRVRHAKAMSAPARSS
ncbi:ABC transporter substrate-binding protein [Leisingera sp. F5]|uniref:ABC transporter substrate-binding protein n=1 Tax=Leisingera sp. F5 TaxID=1813816 RepID=UPI000A70D1AA|nr:ABC transporter substrate-binding protein [Leisingera sp. F5]